MKKVVLYCHLWSTTLAYCCSFWKAQSRRCASYYS